MKIQRVNEMIESKIDFKKTIFFIYWDDWSGLYIDGNLINQGHSLNIYSIFKEICKLKINFSNYKICNLQIDRELNENDFEYFNYNLPTTMKEYYDELTNLGINIKISK